MSSSTSPLLNFLNSDPYSVGDSNWAYGDERSRALGFIATFPCLILILALYAFVCCYLGPSDYFQNMTEEEAANNRQYLKIFNWLRAGLHLSGGVALYYYPFVKCKYSYYCEPLFGHSGYDSLKAEYFPTILYSIWAYFLIKAIDLLDSLFIFWSGRIVSMREFFHHGSMLIITWCAAVFYPSGNTVVPMMLNSFTFSTFFISHKLNTMREKEDQVPFGTLQKISHSVQFLLIIAHAVCGILMNCGYPLIASWVILLYVLLMASPMILNFFNVRFAA